MTVVIWLTVLLCMAFLVWVTIFGEAKPWEPLYKVVEST